MPAPDWLTFLPRCFPSANGALIRGTRPILVDTGFGSDLAATEAGLRDAGVPPERLALIVNTHYHSDHAGGNAGLQARYSLPVAAHRWDAATINARDCEACAAEWLVQPVEPYHVDRPLTNGDTIDAGGVILQVLHTPGHTLGHLCFWEPESGTLIAGDAVHGDDVAWLNPFREGAAPIVRALETLDRLAALPVRWACSGHGAAIADPPGAFDAARRRYESWLTDPRKAGWHACKRIFAYALMLSGGLPAAAVEPYLHNCPWFADYSRHVFATEPTAFAAALLAEMVRSRAAGWRDGRLVALTPHRPPPAGWPSGPIRPRDWPPAPAARP